MNLSPLDGAFLREAVRLYSIYQFKIPFKAHQPVHPAHPYPFHSIDFKSPRKGAFFLLGNVLKGKNEHILG